MPRQRLLNIYLAVFVIISIFFTLTAKTNAESLTLSPLRREIYAEAGQTVNGKLTVKNSSKATSTYSLSVETFSTINEDYDYKLVPGSNDAMWVRYDIDQVNLAAGQSKTITYSLAIPDSAEPGGHYLALVASSEPNLEKGGVVTINRVASLLYISLPGSISKEAKIISLNATKFTTEPKIELVMQLQNTGTVHFRSNSLVTVRNIFGRTISVTDIQKLILPNTIRRIEHQASFPRVPGVYSIEVKVGLGDSKSTIIRKLVIIAPIVPTSMLIILLATAGFLIVKMVRKKQNQSV